METQSIQTLLETIWESNLETLPVKNVNLWLNTMELLHAEKNPNSQWQDLLDAMHKLIMNWNKFYKKWAVNSSTMLIEKLHQVPGGTLAMLFPLQLMTSYLDLWKSYANMVNLELTDSLDSASNTITSISFTTAPTLTEPVVVPSAGPSNLSAIFAPQEDITNLFGNLQNPTGTMSSSISIVQNKEHVKYGIEEPVGEYRLSVSTIIAINIV
jgi:hypothetical protein